MHTTFIINGLTKSPSAPLVAVVAYGYDSMGNPTGDHIRLALSEREADRLSIGDAVEVEYTLRLKAPFIEGFGAPDEVIHPDSEHFLTEEQMRIADEMGTALATEGKWPVGDRPAVVLDKNVVIGGPDSRRQTTRWVDGYPFVERYDGMAPDKLTDYEFLAP